MKTEQKEEWNKYCGDKDLWEKYNFMYITKDGTTKKGTICAIKRDEIDKDLITVNTIDHGSWPCMKYKEENGEIILEDYNKYSFKLA